MDQYPKPSDSQPEFPKPKLDLGCLALFLIPPLLLGIAALTWWAAHPLRYRFAGQEVATVETNGRLLGEVVEDVVRQVETADRKGRKIRVLFSPDNVREKRQVVFGNPPVAGSAEHALYLISADYNCKYAFVESEDTILIFTYDRP